MGLAGSHSTKHMQTFGYFWNTEIYLCAVITPHTGYTNHNNQTINSI